MHKRLSAIAILTALTALAQTPPSFEAATVKPSAPPDEAKVAAAIQAGGKMPTGANVDTRRAQYTRMDLKSLLALANHLRGYQISGPDWMSSAKFDIVARLPDGATKADAPAMLRTLLDERFHIAAHRTSVETPVIALVLAKGGPKLKPAAQPPAAIDDAAPLKPGELTTDTIDGPVHFTLDRDTNTIIRDYGVRGKVARRDDPVAHTIHMDFIAARMDFFAEMLNQVMQLGGERRLTIDMTGLTGYYDFSLDVSLAINDSADSRNQSASDPSGASSSMTEAVQTLGLRLEARRTPIEQLVIDRANKTPEDN